MEATSGWAALYYILLTVMGNFVLLNLLVGVRREERGSLVCLLCVCALLGGDACALPPALPHLPSPTHGSALALHAGQCCV